MSTSADPWLIDSCKLAWHPEWLAGWLGNRNPAPIYIEIGLTDICQHGCYFCSFNYLENRKARLGWEVEQFISQAEESGLKSAMFAGEGEPLLWRGIEILCQKAKELGIDIAVTTNGVALSENLAEKLLPVLTFIRFSINGGNRQSYAEIHKAPLSHFGRVLKNLQSAIRIKRTKNLSCTVGVSSVALPDCNQDLEKLAKLVKDFGADYFSIKPFTPHPMRKENWLYPLDIDKYASIKALEDDSFKVIIRLNASRKLVEKRTYKKCYGIDAITYLDAHGDIYACSNFLGNQDYVFGNIYKSTFRDIWGSARRRQVIDLINAKELEGCRPNCRLDEVNRYLWRLREERPEHLNFI